MSYQSEIARLVRTTVGLLVITLDRCQNSFGVAPCAATGEPCYNTWSTCKDQANYSRGTVDLKFCSANAPLPFAGPRPWLLKESLAATEIRDKLSTTGRLTFTLHDEPDGDVGMDPYLASRASVPFTSYWLKLLARNPNYAGRQVNYYRGVLGQPEEDFELDWRGQLDGIEAGNGRVTIEAVDPLKLLSDVTVPPKVAVKLASDLAADADQVACDKLAGLPAAGVVKVDDEIIGYAAINATTRMLTGCSRGAHGTDAATHRADAKLTLCAYYEPTNGFDLLQRMLTDNSDVTLANPPGAGIAAALVAGATFAAQRDYAAWEVPFSALIVEPTKLDKLFWEVAGLLDCYVWQDEGQQVTCRRNMQDPPGSAHPTWSDAGNLVHGSVRVDLNEQSRVDRVVLRYDLGPLGKPGEQTDYQATDIAVNGDTSSENSYDKPAEREILCRWLRRSWSPYLPEEKLAAYVRALTARLLLRRADAMPLVDLEVEIKDGAVRTGGMVKLTTDALLLPDGSPLDGELFMAVKRNPKGARLAYRVLRQPDDRLAFFAPAGHPDYDDADAGEREYGYFSDSDGMLPDGSAGHVFF